MTLFIQFKILYISNKIWKNLRETWEFRQEKKIMVFVSICLYQTSCAQ